MINNRVISPPPEWVPGFEPAPFTSGAGLALLFDWQELGRIHTALRFVVRLDVGSGVVFTPEASYWPEGPPEIGPEAPVPFRVSAGQCYGDPYGIDEMRRYWRLWAQGAGSGVFGVVGISRWP